MFEIKSQIELKRLLSFYRRNIHSELILTNWFFSNTLSNELLVFENCCGVFFLDYDRVIDRFNYYFLADKRGIGDLALKFPTSKKVVSEHISQDEPNNDIYLHFKKNGFVKYASLIKMSLLGENQNISLSKFSNIEQCTENDFHFIRNVFNKHFDSISERLPTDREIDEAIRFGSIFKLASSSLISAFYWADVKKVVSELRYIYVGEKFRGRGIGRQLLEHHLTNTEGVKKHQLWVLDGNIPAINLYKRYGYRFDQLIDTVYFRG